jgi:hypothetical protein
MESNPEIEAHDFSIRPANLKIIIEFFVPLHQ